MVRPPAGKKPAPKKATPAKKPAAAKKAAGKAAPARKKIAVGAKSASAEVEKQHETGLTHKQQRFVDEYLVDLNAKQAAIRAGYSATNAESIGYQLLQKTPVSVAIEEGRKRQQERTGIQADRVLLEAWHVATADARELVEVKTGCCRCCYGEGHKHQRTVAEMNHDRELWVLKGKGIEDFDEEGGIGFDPLRAPHPECPNCGGDGQARVALKDTRALSAPAVALYAGAKETKYGIEIQMHDKGAALEKLFKHLGLYEKDNNQKTDPLTALLARIATQNASGLVPVQHDPEAQHQQIAPRSTIGPAGAVQPGGADDDDED